ARPGLAQVAESRAPARDLNRSGTHAPEEDRRDDVPAARRSGPPVVGAASAFVREEDEHPGPEPALPGVGARVLLVGGARRVRPANGPSVRQPGDRPRRFEREADVTRVAARKAGGPPPREDVARPHVSNVRDALPSPPEAALRRAFDRPCEVG